MESYDPRNKFAQSAIYASFNPPPRTPRNATLLAVSFKSNPGWLFEDGNEDVDVIQRI